MIQNLSQAIIALQVVLLIAMAGEAYLLASEISALEQEIAAAAPASIVPAECAKAVWPDIPLHCLERISSRSSATTTF